MIIDGWEIFTNNIENFSDKEILSREYDSYFCIKIYRGDENNSFYKSSIFMTDKNNSYEYNLRKNNGKNIPIKEFRKDSLFEVVKCAMEYLDSNTNNLLKFENEFSSLRNSSKKIISDLIKNKHIHEGTKKRYAESLNIAESNINKSLDELVNKKIITMNKKLNGDYCIRLLDDWKTNLCEI